MHAAGAPACGKFDSDPWCHSAELLPWRPSAPGCLSAPSGPPHRSLGSRHEHQAPPRPQSPFRDPAPTSTHPSLLSPLTDVQVQAPPLHPHKPPPARLAPPGGPSHTRVTIQPEAIHVLVDEGRVPYEDVQLVGHGDARTREQPQRPGRSEYRPGGRAADGPLPGAPRFRSPHPEPRTDHFRDREGGAGAAREEAEAVEQPPLSAGGGVPGSPVPTATPAPTPARPVSPTLESFPVTSSVPPPRFLCSFKILTGLYPKCGSLGLNPNFFFL